MPDARQVKARLVEDAQTTLERTSKNTPPNLKELLSSNIQEIREIAEILIINRDIIKDENA